MGTQPYSPLSGVSGNLRVGNGPKPAIVLKRQGSKAGRISFSPRENHVGHSFVGERPSRSSARPQSTGLGDGGGHGVFGRSQYGLASPFIPTRPKRREIHSVTR